MRIIAIIVMKSEVRMDEVVEPVTFMYFVTRLWAASKIVCLQANAIVKPRVMMTRRRI